MGRTTTITCDGCGRNLSDKPYLHLEGGMTHWQQFKDIAAYFCSLDCLRSWLRVLEGK